MFEAAVGVGGLLVWVSVGMCERMSLVYVCVSYVSVSYVSVSYVSVSYVSVSYVFVSYVSVSLCLCVGLADYGVFSRQQ